MLPKCFMVSYMNTKKDLFLLVIKYLDSSNLPYVILGNTSTLPKEIPGDVDIGITTRDFNRINSIISDFCRVNDVKCLNVFHHEVTCKYFVIMKEIDGRVCSLSVDFCSHYVRNARLLLTDIDILSNRKLTSKEGVEFYICNEITAFKYYLLKKVEKGVISDRDYDYLSSIIQANQAEVTRHINSLFGYYLGKKMVAYLLQGKFVQLTAIDYVELSNYLKGKYHSKTFYFLKDIVRRLSRLRFPTGLTIAIYGCDGSGKSTVINELLTQLPEMDVFRGAKYHHLYAKDSGNSNKAVVSNPHEFKSRSWLMSNLKLLFFLYKYCFSFLKIVYWQKVRSQLVVFDRYYYDILVDPVRYRHKGSKWFALLVGRLIPKPDLSFILDASEDILRARKEEVSHEETIRQRREYINLANSISNCTVIDNSSQIEFAVNDIKTVILNFLAKRYQDRYPT